MKINFSKKNINIISFFISILIFITIIFSLNLFIKKSSQISYSFKNQQQNNLKSNLLENSINQDINVEKIFNWKIEIEKLNINANIKDGIEENIIKNYVGHYTNSNIMYGIIALKAYNTGKEINYFANLKELEINDEIKYIVNDYEDIYKVISNKIIDGKDLKNSKDEYDNILNSTLKEDNIQIQSNNILLLITYVKDMPNKYRCVIAKN